MHLVMTVFYDDTPSSPLFLRGDANGDGVFHGLVDALFSFAFQFQSGSPPPCLEAADANGDGIYNGLSDGIFSLVHQFQGGPPPPAPYPACGPDPSPGNSLGCGATKCP